MPTRSDLELNSIKVNQCWNAAIALRVKLVNLAILFEFVLELGEPERLNIYVLGAGAWRCL